MCENVIVDEQTKTVSMISMLENINSQAYPIFLHRLSVFLFLEKSQPTDADNCDLKITGNIAGKTLIDTVFPFSFQGRPTTRVILTFGGVMIPEPGTVEFNFSVDGNSVGKWSFFANKLS